MEQLEVVDTHWLDIKMKEEFRELVYEEKRFLEYESTVVDSPRRSSALLVNKGKNRYNCFRPLETTRVILQQVDGIEGSDYINANYINGEAPHTLHKYIACQAPLESTITDFWRMIWEQRCGVIVMLTELDEGNNKAHQYWPEEGQIKRYGNLMVCHKKNFQIGEIQVRSLLLKESTSQGNAREIIHLQYNNWPDFGVPSTTKSIRDLLVLITKFKERAVNVYSLSGPIVVHCSAGVGRTGVFIACHITLDRLNHNHPPNVKETVRKIRAQRQGMVRTEAQYILIYLVLLDSLRTNLLKDLKHYDPRMKYNSNSYAVAV